MMSGCSLRLNTSVNRPVILADFTGFSGRPTPIFSYFFANYGAGIRKKLCLLFFLLLLCSVLFPEFLTAAVSSRPGSSVSLNSNRPDPSVSSALARETTEIIRRDAGLPALVFTPPDYSPGFVDPPAAQLDSLSAANHVEPDLKMAAEEKRAEAPEENENENSEANDEDEEDEEDEEELMDHFLQDEGIVAAELPGESELNISGRKYIAGDFSHTRYLNDPERSDRTDVSVDQQLQVDVYGSIADDLLEIEIEYDDSRPRVERQRTRVKYNGRERDVGFATFRAEALFGDVRLSLPRARFVSYNKSTFGLTGEIHLTDFRYDFLQPEEVSFYGVAAQEKGETRRKEFTGETSRQIPDPVEDINPVRRTYYQPLADYDTEERRVVSGSEVVYIDDQDRETVDGNTLEDLVVKNENVEDGPDTYEGNFNVMEPGEDYSIDYRTGKIRFRRRIQSDYVIAVEMEVRDANDLGDPDPFMIKDEDESERFTHYHLQNRYRLGSSNIIRDDPDRVLHVRDRDGNRRVDGETHYVEILGVDDGAGQIDDEHINFERGEIEFPDTQPFMNPKLPETNPTVYGSPGDRERKYEIYQELLVEEHTYTLGIDVVRESEEVTVDGESLSRNQDYMIDYQTGFLTFFEHVDIDEDSEIEVTYESMGIGARDKTFLGGRMEAKLTDNIEVGSTILLDQMDEASEIPQLGRESAKTTVYEHDISWRPLHTLQDALAEWGGYERFVDRPLDRNLELDLQANYARSVQDPSQEGAALIDDFRNLEREIPFSKNHLNWLPADAPQRLPGDSTVFERRAPVEFDERDAEGHEPDPDDEDDQSSLEVSMDFSDVTDDTSEGDTPYWSAVQHQFSRRGEDVRGYKYLKFWMKEEDAGGTISVDFGQLTEDISRNNVLNAEHNWADQVLKEDKGFKVYKGMEEYYRFGADNGQLDGEDRRRTGYLNTRERYLSFDNINKNDSVRSDTTEHGWVRYKIPLSSGERFGDADVRGDSTGDIPDTDDILRNAQAIRLHYEAAEDELGDEVKFLLEEMGVARPSWRTPDAAPDDLIQVISSAEDNRLPAPGTSKYRDSDDRPLDRAMQMNFESAPDSDVHQAWYEFPEGSNLTHYENLRLYFNTKNAGSADTGYLRFGRSENNYFEYRFPLDSPDDDDWIRPLVGGQDWYRLDIEIEQFEEDLIEMLLNDDVEDTYVVGNRRIKGEPNPVNVRWYQLALEGETGNEGNVVFNNLSVHNTREQEGEAKFVGGDYNIREGLLEGSFGYEEEDGEFRTVGDAGWAITDEFVPEDLRRRTLDGNVDVDRFIPENIPVNVPFSFRWYDDRTEIPPDRVERVRDDDLGLVEEEYYSYRTGLQTPSAYPDFDFDYSFDDREVIRERDDEHWLDENKEWRLSGDYSQTFSDPIWGYLPVGERLSISTRASLRRKWETRESLGERDVSERDREERRRRFNTSLGLNPYSWVEIDPGYSFSDLYRWHEDEEDGRVSRDQDFDLDVGFSRFYGLRPQFDFDLGFSESFDRRGEKDVDLSGGSGLNLQTDPERWWSALEFLSLRYRFSMDASATYEDRPADESLSRLYSDFFEDLSWLLQGPELEVDDEDLTLSRTGADKSISHNFSGRLDLWDPLRTSYNFSHSESHTQSDGSVRRSTTESFSLDNRLELHSVSNIIAENAENSTLNFDYSLSLSEDRREESIEHSVDIGWNTTWNERWRTGFDLRTSFDRTEDRKVTYRERVLSPSLDFRWLASKSDEQRLWFENRLEVSGSIDADFDRRTRDGSTRADNETYRGRFSTSYNFTDDVRSSLGGNIRYRVDNYEEARDELEYGIHGSVDFRF